MTEPDEPSDPSEQPDVPDIAPPESVPPVSAEQLVDGEEAPAPVEEERRYPSTIGGAFYLLVLAITAAGLVVVTYGSWRTGIRVVGGSLVLAALVRLVLSSRDAGMLAVRNKGIDMVLLCGLGGALIFLASSIPNQPGT